MTAPRYKEVPGLLRKYYTVGAEDLTTGGVFVWDSLDHANAGHATQLILSDPDYLEAAGAATAELLE